MRSPVVSPVLALTGWNSPQVGFRDLEERYEFLQKQKATVPCISEVT